MDKTQENSRYKDLLVWQKSILFADQVLELIDQIDTSRKHYRLLEQLEAAATSIPMNVAEGKGRNSQKEFMHFLYIARGSLYETMTLLEIFKLRGWIGNEQFTELEYTSTEIAKMINSLINAITKSL
jgi:four helix bundle protein